MESQNEEYKPTPSPEPHEGTSFSMAICEVKIGKKLTRLSWNEPKTYIFLNGGRLRIMKKDGSLHDLIVSDGDIFGEDWVVVE